MRFEQKLRALMAERRETGAALARSIGANASVVSRWRQGTERPTAAKYLALARHYGVSMETLVDDTLDPPARPAAGLADDEAHLLTLARRVGIGRALDRILLRP